MTILIMREHICIHKLQLIYVKDCVQLTTDIQALGPIRHPPAYPFPDLSMSIANNTWPLLLAVVFDVVVFVSMIGPAGITGPFHIEFRG